jgi:ABC-2 type transport system permease protein
MLRLLKIEFRKLASYRVFWFFMIMYFVLFVLLISVFKNFSDTIMFISKTNFFAYPKVWHNTAFIASFYKVIPAVFFIIYISNEIEYRTLRQNIIDGLSKREFLIGKVNIIFIFSLISTIFVFFVAFIFGEKDYDITDPKYEGVIYIFMLFFQTFVFLLFVSLISILVRKSGLAIGLALVYPYIIEPIIAWRWENIITDNLPMRSIHQLIRPPLLKFFNFNPNTGFPYDHFILTLVYGVLFTFLFYLIIKKKNI